MRTPPYSTLRAVLNAGICLSVLTATATVAHAQVQDDDTNETRQMDTVIVTSAKREQTLQDTPIAVSVVSSDVLDEAEIIDIVDLQSVVPSLQVSQATSTIQTAFTIRGFGSASNNAGIEPSVGVFVDGVYRSRPSAALSDLLNVSRVEVLRGPQSTLFGKNASVGVVSIITKEPEFETGGMAELTYANNNTIRLVGDVTGPISDNLAFRLAASYNKGDGYAENLTTGEGVNDRNRWAVQGQLLFNPTDDLSFRLIADYDEIDETCCISANVVAGPATVGILNVIGDIVIEDPFSYEYFATFDPSNELTNYGVSLHSEKQFGFADLTSITAYRKGENSTLYDIDQSTADVLNSFNDGESETFTQEVRLTSTATDAKVDWLVGAYYFDETIDFPGGLDYGADARAFYDPFYTALSGVPNLLGLVENAFSITPGLLRSDATRTLELRGQDNMSWSLFGTADWHITDQLTATVGLGYIYDEKEAYVTQINDDLWSQLNLAVINPALAPLQTLPQTFPIPNQFEDGKSEDDDVTYNLRLAYDANDNLNLYASYATGFKATAWNLSRDSRPTPEVFQQIVDAGLETPNLRAGGRLAGPETSEVYELGLKAQYDTFSVNLALFEQSVNDFQTNVLTGTAGRILANADEQSSTGLEIDATWAPIDDLVLSFAGTFVDAEYESFPDSAFGDLTGETPANIPETTTSTGFRYGFDVMGLDSFVRADWQHSEGATYTDNAALQDFIGFTRDFDLVNASAGFTTDNGFDVSIWGRNIFGEEYFTLVFQPVLESGSLAGFPNQPETYGVTIRKRF
ncbi:MAG: TonB-dependent receptor [Pseudomonadota bacterium]